MWLPSATSLFNPFNLDFNLHILLTDLHIFITVLVGRTCFHNKSILDADHHWDLHCMEIWLWSPFICIKCVTKFTLISLTGRSNVLEQLLKLLLMQLWHASKAFDANQTSPKVPNWCEPKQCLKEPFMSIWCIYQIQPLTTIDNSERLGQRQSLTSFTYVKSEWQR